MVVSTMDNLRLTVDNLASSLCSTVWSQGVARRDEPSKPRSHQTGEMFFSNQLPGNSWPQVHASGHCRGGRHRHSRFRHVKPAE